MQLVDIEKLRGLKGVVKRSRAVVKIEFVIFLTLKSHLVVWESCGANRDEK